MRKIVFLIFILTIDVFAQKEDTKYNNQIYVYKTFENFKNDNGEYIGDYEDYFNNPLYNTFAFTFTKENDRIKYSKLAGKMYYRIKNSYWGFKIRDKIFRRYNISDQTNIVVLKHKEKVFYISSSIIFGELNGYDMTTSFQSNHIYYSDDFTSKVYPISKILKKEKNNNSLKNFNKCIEKAKERFGIQAELNSQIDCINEF